MRSGVCRGCVLYPILFNIYTYIIREALEENGNRVLIINIRYADDRIVIAQNIRELGQLIKVVVEYS